MQNYPSFPLRIDIFWSEDVLELRMDSGKKFSPSPFQIENFWSYVILEFRSKSRNDLKGWKNFPKSIFLQSQLVSELDRKNLGWEILLLTPPPALSSSIDIFSSQ